MGYNLYVESYHFYEASSVWASVGAFVLREGVTLVLVLADVLAKDPVPAREVRRLWKKL